ncbi:MAG: hypothetical protein VB060_08790 [Oscillibacter sp.]|uniref:hypothetical protein n=1 Tax=uncultured Oscillibacter sp. TaxID=876091 RepID=UPI0025F86168|nr:hypothetical protein [Oscillibacter sp.]MEA4993910.1 hypothetical protein [Oscillibacter sp.]
MPYEILSGDTVVAETGTFDRITVIDPARCPLYLKRNDDFAGWLENRAIDRHRTNSRVLKRVLRLSEKNDQATALHFNAATITDNFWVREKGSTLRYADVRFQSNLFDQVALHGSTSGFLLNPSRTPELTNTGSYEKCWKRLDGRWNMIKRESLAAIFSEVFIYHLGAALGFPMAKYRRYDRDTVQSEDFTADGKYNLQTARALLSEDYESDFPYNCKLFEKLSPDMLKQYLEILFMDALCMNYDRHIDNYGILTDPKSGAIVSMAPNFDNNLALLTNDLNKWEPVMGFLGDYRDLFSEYPAPAVSMDQLSAAIESAYSAAAAEFSTEELRSLRSKSEIGQFILQSYCVICNPSLNCVQYMNLDEEPELQ